VSAPTSVRTIPEATIDDLLGALRLDPDDLDPLLPIRVAYSGNHHPIVAVTGRALDQLDQDDERLRELMAREGWGATVAVVHRRSDREFEARNPFPPGGVREDPATGSAAAALGGYLRELDLVEPGSTVVIRQGRHLGRPGTLTVEVTPDGGIPVTGTAVAILQQ
jgi:PhzF family phenazine biosynthesis protein